jgi:plastocyanin
VAGASDAAGSPFWFNGQPSASVDPHLLGKAGDGKVSKGQKDVDHEALNAGDKPVPYTLRFPKAGRYKIYDGLHPGVVNTVTVVKKRARVPGAAADKAAATKQAIADKREALKLAAVKPAPSTILAGNDTTHVGFFQFFSPETTVKVGQPVTISSGKTINFIHDFAIGPDQYMKDTASGFFQPGPTGVTLGAPVIYPSQPAGAGALTFDGTQNGGYVNTGLLDTDPSTPTVPNKATITFTKPGAYKYVCLIHSDGIQGMSGTITVQ